MDFQNKSITKAQMAEIYGVSATYLREQLNNRYFDELEAVGYKKKDIIISPNVLRKFIEIYGKPITNNDLSDEVL